MEASGHGLAGGHEDNSKMQAIKEGFAELSQFGGANNRQSLSLLCFFFVPGTSAATVIQQRQEVVRHSFVRRAPRLRGENHHHRTGSPNAAIAAT